LTLDVVDPDGASIIPPEATRLGQIVMGRPWNIEPGIDQVQPLVRTYNGIVFQRAGDFAVVLRANGVDIARAPFHVRLNGVGVPHPVGV
jgi:hypothetical protein